VSAAILIREAVAAAAAEGPQRKVQITESIDDLGVVRVDGKRIREAITHLVRNAIRFTPDGGSIEVSARVRPRPLSHHGCRCWRSTESMQMDRR
jgi:signal transduction histidine kinase